MCVTLNAKLSTFTHCETNFVNELMPSHYKMKKKISWDKKVNEQSSRMNSILLMLRWILNEAKRNDASRLAIQNKR